MSTPRSHFHSSKYPGWEWFCLSVLQWGRIPWEFPDHERLGEGLGLLVGQLPFGHWTFCVGLESSRNVTYSQGLEFRPVYGVHHALVGGYHTELGISHCQDGEEIPHCLHG